MQLVLILVDNKPKLIISLGYVYIKNTYLIFFNSKATLGQLSIIQEELNYFSHLKQILKKKYFFYQQIERITNKDYCLLINSPKQYFNCYNKNITKMDKENLSPLRQKLGNTKNFFREEAKPSKYDPILQAVQQEINNNSCDLLGVLLTDPLLKQLNSSLQKQAEQQKKSKLLETFPLRYKNLVHTEILYKKLQQNIKDMEKQSKEVIELQMTERQQLHSQIQYLKSQLQRKDEDRIKQKQNFEEEKGQLKSEFSQQLSKKEGERQQVQQEKNEIQRKMIKIRCEKDNLIEYLEQVKDESEILKKQNQRIIQLLTANQLELNRLSKTIHEKEDSYRISKQHFMSQLERMQLQCDGKLQKRSKQLSDVLITNQGLKRRLRQCEEEIISLANQVDEQESTRYEEIQEVRSKLLEVVREKNVLEEEYQNYKEQKSLDIQRHCIRISQLEQQITNKNIEISQRNLQHELQMHKLKQIVGKLQGSKDETIDQIKQNINLINQQKVLLQGRIVKLQSEKDSLYQLNQKLKQQLQANNKKFTQFRNDTKKSENKNIQVQKIVPQFKQQLGKFGQILQEKQAKIQQYRKQIMSLKGRIKQCTLLQGKTVQQNNQYSKQVSHLSNELDRTKKQLSKYMKKEIIFMEEIQNFQKHSNRKRHQTSTQVQIIEGLNDIQILQQQSTVRQLQKTKLKYLNVIEQLNEYKKEYEQILAEKDQIIKAFQVQNSNIKDLIGSKLNEGNQIQSLLDLKIGQLKVFYERKIEEQGKKYRNIIEVLKKQVTELYNQIDLKKSMQQQMFTQIMKLNEERRQK